MVSWRDGSKTERSKTIEYDFDLINLEQINSSLPKMFKGLPTLLEITDVLILCNLPKIYKMKEGEIEVCRGFSQANQVGFMAKLQMLERLLYFSLTQCCELFRLNESHMSFYFMDLQDFIAVSATKPEAISIGSS